MLNPYLTPPPRVWPVWLRSLLVTIGLGWIGVTLWHVIEVRQHDPVLAATGLPVGFAWPKVSQIGWSIAIVAYVVAVSAALGVDVIVRNFRGTLTPVVAFPVHVAVGLGIFGLVFFLLGIAQGGYSLWALATILAGAGVNLLRWHRYRRPAPEETFENPPETFLWYFLILAPVVVATAAALAPPLAAADLSLHLESPRHVLDAGRLDAPRWSERALLPNLLHHVYVPMMALDVTAAAPRLLNVFLGVLIVHALYRIGGFWFSPRAGGVAGLLFLSTPVVMEEWATAGLDIGAAFFVTVAMLVLLIAPMNRAYAHARLAGALGGAALACAPSAVSAVAGLLVFAASRWWRLRKDAEDTIGLYPPNLHRLLLAFLWPLPLVLAPFWVRAWIESGRPLDLFAVGGLGAAAPAVMGEGTLRDYLMAPWRLVARGSADLPERFGGVLQPWLVILAPLALGWPQNLRKVLLLVMMLAAGGAVWFATGQQARFLIPMVPWAALIGGMGFDALIRGFGRGARPFASGALAVLLVGTGLFLQRPGDLLRFSENVLTVVTPDETRDEHLRRNLDIYPALAWLNNQSPDAAGALLLLDNRGHHLEMPWVADDDPADSATLRRWAANPSERLGEAIVRDLRHGFETPVSHVVLNTRAPGPLAEPSFRRVWDALGPHLDEVFADNGFTVFRVRHAGPPLTAAPVSP